MIKLILTKENFEDVLPQHKGKAIMCDIFGEFDLFEDMCLKLIDEFEHYKFDPINHCEIDGKFAMMVNTKSIDIDDFLNTFFNGNLSIIDSIEDLDTTDINDFDDDTIEYIENIYSTFNIDDFLDMAKLSEFDKNFITKSVTI